MPGRSELAAPVTSRSRKSVASTRTWPFVSAATVKPQSTDLANESSTDLRSSGFALLDRKDMFGCTIRTRGPTRWNDTMRAPPPAPRSRPMSLDPSPAARPVLNRKSLSKRGISMKSEPVRSSQ